MACLALVGLSSCGGGTGGGGGPETPPPPTVPPVYSTPTAVRVSQSTPFASNCLALQGGSTVYANAEVEPHLAIDPSNPSHLVAAWQQDRLSDGGARGIVTAVSTDGGLSWTGLQAASFSQCAGGSFARVSDPCLGMSGTATIQVAIAFTGAALTAGARSAVLASRSQDGGYSWEPPVVLIEDDGSQFFNDKETVTVDPTDPRYVYVVWDRLEGNDRGPAMLARSTDGGASWSPATVIYDPGSGGRQTIGNTIVVTAAGDVFDFFTELQTVPGGQTVGHLAVIRSTDQGVTWSPPTKIADLLSVGTRIPSAATAVRAGEILASFAADPVNGTLYAVWQDSRFSGGSRDGIAVSWSRDGGATWSAPAQVNAEPSVPAFTPTLAVLPDSSIGVMYYDFRTTGSASFQPTDLWLAATNDARSWRETRLAGNFDFLNAPNAGGLFIGDYQGLTGDDTTFVTLYTRTNNGDSMNRTDVFSDRVDAGGLPLAVTTRLPGQAAPTWSAAAQDRVGQHLTEIRERRRRQWQQWLAGGGAPPARR